MLNDTHAQTQTHTRKHSFTLTYRYAGLLAQNSLSAPTAGQSAGFRVGWDLIPEPLIPEALEATGGYKDPLKLCARSIEEGAMSDVVRGFELRALEI